MSLLNIYFLIGSFLGIVFVYLFYASTFYPFEGTNIIFYIEYINYYLTKNKLSPYLLLYLISLILASIYYFFFKRIKFGILLKGVIVSLIVFVIYVLILLIIFGLDRLNYMQIYVLQDLIALIIFYLTLSLIYRRV
jgi:hypothetical protein